MRELKKRLEMDCSSLATLVLVLLLLRTYDSTVMIPFIPPKSFLFPKRLFGLKNEKCLLRISKGFTNLWHLIST